MYGADVDSFSKDVQSSLDKYKPSWAYEDDVVAGYEAIAKTTAETIWKSDIGQVELLLMNSDAEGAIGITAALQHPYSHGRVYVNSSDPMDYPVIDPNYLNNPSDLEMMVKGVKAARALGQSAAMAGSLGNETAPGLNATSDADIEDWIRKAADTEFHPSSTCAMLPRDKGGVVDAKLRVYGFANMRVADASIPPVSFSSHLMASTYGIAEIASEIIRQDYRKGSDSSFASANGGSDDSSKDGDDDSAAPSASSVSGWAFGLVIAVAASLYV